MKKILPKKKIEKLILEKLSKSENYPYTFMKGKTGGEKEKQYYFNLPTSTF